MCFLWTRVFVVWRSAMASSKNRWLELRVHPLELSTMREALYLPMTLLVLRFLWVCLESVVIAVAYAMFQSVAGWTFWVFSVYPPTVMEEDLCETWWWIATGIINWLPTHLDIRVLWLASFVHYGSEVLSASSQCFWVTVGKRWPLFNRCHQLVAASPWHPCYMCFGWRLFLKNCWCKGLLLSTVAQKYWVLKLTMFLSDSRQEVAFVYDDGVCVFQLAHGRLHRTN